MTALTRLPTRKATATTTWMRDGLCRQVDADLFFPEGMGAAITRQTKAAKKVCNQCPVQQLCLDWAVETGQRSGVWGGASPDERDALRQVPDESQFLRCLGQQEFIERRVAEGGTHRQVAGELGVGHQAVGRAWRHFEAERETAAVEAVKAA